MDDSQFPKCENNELPTLTFKELQQDVLYELEFRYHVSYDILVLKGFKDYLQKFSFINRIQNLLLVDRFHHAETRASTMKSAYIFAVLQRFKNDHDERFLTEQKSA